MTVFQAYQGARRWVRGLTSLRTSEFVVDMFAGGGGTSKGIEAALGRDVDVALNHDQHAIAIHRLNHPRTEHFLCDVREVDPRQVMPNREIGLLWLSPDCTHHSRAKGGKPAKRNRRALANVGTVWAAARKPRIIILENVEEFEGWGPLDDQGQPDKSKKGQSFKRWVGKLRSLGYEVDWRSLVAADYGAPTVRKRLFLIARCDGKKIVWPAATHAPAEKSKALGLKTWRAAYECIDFSLPAKSIFGRKKDLAQSTLKRIVHGLFIQEGEPFIVLPGHQGPGFRGQSLKAPMATITASRDYGALVMPMLIQMGYGERKGQAPRVLNLKKPLGTVVGGGLKHGLVITQLNSLRGTSKGARDPRLPMPSLTAGGKHLAEVRAFLVKYYGTAKTATLKNPMPTVTTKARLGLVVVKQELYQIVDIFFRMLVPRELLNGQFGKYAADYVLIGTQEEQVKAVGNSVPPEVAEALVRANVKLRGIL